MTTYDAQPVRRQTYSYLAAIKRNCTAITYWTSEKAS